MKSQCRISLMLMALMAIVCSCGTFRTTPSPAEEAIIADLQGLLLEQGTCERLLLKEAFGWKNTPYRWGGTGRRGVDCSGFVMKVYDNSLGIKLPRTSAAQAKHCKKVNKKHLAPGDLVFFNTRGRGVSHVGLYVGHGEFIHASSSKGVMVSRLDHNYWNKRLVKCGRVPAYISLLKYEKTLPPPPPTAPGNSIQQDTIVVPLSRLTVKPDSIAMPQSAPEVKPDTIVVPQPVPEVQPKVHWP